MPKRIISTYINNPKPTAEALRDMNTVINSILSGTLAEDYEKMNDRCQKIINHDLIKNGIISKDMNKIHIFSGKSEISPFINELYNFLTDGNEKTFKELIDKLLTAEYEFKVNLSIIPLYLSVVLKQFKNHVEIMKNEEICEPTAELLRYVCRFPECYTVWYYKLDDEIIDFAAGLLSIFCSFKVNFRLHSDLPYLFDKMRKWYINLPKFARNAKSIYTGFDSDCSLVKAEYLKFIQTLAGMNTTPERFVFYDLKIIFHTDDYKKIFGEITEIKKFYDRLYDSLFYQLKCDIYNILQFNKEESLIYNFECWYKKLSAETVSYFNNNVENKLLNLITGLVRDDEQLIYALIETVTGIAFEDWETPDIAKAFCGDLKMYIHNIENKANQVVDEEFINYLNLNKILINKNAGCVSTLFYTDDKSEFFDRGILTRYIVNLMTSHKIRTINEAVNYLVDLIQFVYSGGTDLRP